jgi:hypothetical protein
MTAPAKTASNGTKPTPERTNGMARVRDAQIYHLASLAHDAAWEGERLCSGLYQTASAGYSYQRQSEPGALNMADDPAIAAKTREAIACLYTAITYLTDLSGGLTDA